VSGLRKKELDYDARRRPKTDHHCVRCQRDIKPGSRYRMVHVIDGGGQILHPADEAAYVSDAGEMGLHPVGMDCARTIGLEWTQDPFKEASNV